MNTRLFLYQFAKSVHATNPDFVVYGVEKEDQLLEIHVVHNNEGTAVSVPKSEIPTALENTEIIYLLAQKTVAKIKPEVLEGEVIVKEKLDV